MGGDIAIAVCLVDVGLGGLPHVAGGGGGGRHASCGGRDSQGGHVGLDTDITQARTLHW